MAYYPYSQLKVQFTETHVDVEGIQETFTAGELAVIMLSTNQVLRGYLQSLKVLSVGDNSLLFPLIVWRVLGSDPNPLHEFFLHNMWDESGLNSIKQQLASTGYPFVVRNGLVENTLRSYFPGQVALIFYGRAESVDDPDLEYQIVYEQASLLKNAVLPGRFVLISKPLRDEVRRALEDAFVGFRVKRFQQAPALIVITPLQFSQSV